jgi:hypothetical protein
MKGYWTVYYDKPEYKLHFRVEFPDKLSDIEIALFTSFDMAYDYVTKLNGSQHLGQTYSRWTVKR